MEKLGVEKSQLKKELQNEYNALKEKQVSLVKQGSASADCKAVESRLSEIKNKIADIDAE